MVKKNWVDCENWDVFSVMAGKHIQTIQEDREDVADKLGQLVQKEKKQLAQKENPSPVATPNATPTPKDSFLHQFRAMLAAEKPGEAWGV